jgi:hypothetical protein
LKGVFEAIDDVKETITEAIIGELHGEAMSVFIRETIAELDEISGRYETGIVWVEEAVVASLTADRTLNGRFGTPCLETILSSGHQSIESAFGGKVAEPLVPKDRPICPALELLHDESRAASYHLLK